MKNRVLTLPASQSALLVHEFGVYSIQQNRQVLEQLGSGVSAYFAVREGQGGRMYTLYQIEHGGLLLHPMQQLAPQLDKLSVLLPGSAQLRLVKYMDKTLKVLGSDYAKPQLFYLLKKVADLPRKPRPARNGQWPLYFDLTDLLA